jgi:putative effector of murein hydrolase
MDQMTIAFAQLKTSYENDMKEVQILTEVLKNSIVSLEFQLEQKKKQLQLLLRSELLDRLCVTVTGSRMSTRSELVTAFWNEKPETRVQLLDWFSDLQSQETPVFHTPQQHAAARQRFEPIHR